MKLSASNNLGTDFSSCFRIDYIIRLCHFPIMKTVFISEFKARCIAIINEVNRTHSSVIITRRGKPIARLEPVTNKKPERILGDMGKMTIKGDIIHADFSNDWEING